MNKLSFNYTQQLFLRFITIEHLAPTFVFLQIVFPTFNICQPQSVS
jgi:hypothetical protein